MERKRPPRPKIFTKVMAKQNLRKERVSRGYTIGKFASEIGYTQSAYSKVELRRNGMGPRGIEAICRVLNLDFDEIFEFTDGDEHRTPEPYTKKLIVKAKPSLKQMRIARGLTVLRLATRCNYSSKSLDKLEKEISKTSVQRAETIANFLKCDFEDLFYIIDSEEHDNSFELIDNTEE